LDIPLIISPASGFDERAWPGAGVRFAGRSHGA